jgi:rhodanese-related sulfurtransferase
MKALKKIFLTLLVFISLTACSNGQSRAENTKSRQEQVAAGDYKDVDASAFRKMLEEKKGILLDVRTPSEYEEGHLPGAREVNFLSDDFVERISKLDKDTTYLIYCRSGHRSHQAGTKMKELGYKVVNLKGGILGWEDHGFEIEK